MRIASAGHAAFAAVLIALGIQGLLHGDFTAVWQPVPTSMPAREALAYVCAVVFLGCGVGVLSKRTAPPAARILLACLLLWLLLLRLPEIFTAPAAFVSWDGFAETTVVVAAAWTLYAWFAVDAQQRVGFAAGTGGVRIARALFGLGLLPFGVGHFLYVKQTAALVPAWLPAHVAWVYLTGAAFLAAGVAVLVNVYARLAAALSALQIGLFTLVVWVPILAAGSKDAYQWSEFGLSSALTAAAWVVADSYR